MPNLEDQLFDPAQVDEREDLANSFKIVEIPTIASFLAWPHSNALDMLEEWAIIPIGYEACYYCHQLLPASRFSRFQRRLTSARQRSLAYDYRSWKPEKHFCITCGVENKQYELGQPIYVGFGDPGSMWESVVPCTYCGELNPSEEGLFLDCGHFRVPMQVAREVEVPYESSRIGVREAEAVFPMGGALEGRNDRASADRKVVDKSNIRAEPEPSFRMYMHARPEEILAMVGEKLLRGRQGESNEDAYLEFHEAYMNSS